MLRSHSLPLVASLTVVVLLLASCSDTADDSVDTTLAPTTTTIATSATPATPAPAEAPATTTAPSTTHGATTSSMVDIVVSECSPPSAVRSGDSELFVDLHRAVEAVVQDTNALGAAVLGVEDFGSGWEKREPVASSVEPLLADLAVVEAVAASVLVDEYGARYDEEGLSWVFPESMWPLSPPFGYLEELAMAPSMYRDDILPMLYAKTTLGEAVQHWNYGASPCGQAHGMVERLEGARSLFSS